MWVIIGLVVYMILLSLGYLFVRGARELERRRRNCEIGTVDQDQPLTLTSEVKRRIIDAYR